MSDNKTKLSIKTIVEQAKQEDQQEQAQEQTKTSAPQSNKDYQAMRLHQIIRADGSKFKRAADGCFYPTTDEEQALCAYYVTIGRLLDPN